MDNPKYFIDDDCIFADYMIMNGAGDVIAYKRQCVITKEAFVMAYNNWIKGESDNEHNLSGDVSTD